ncbi:heavy metal translocating P-type ATPase [Apilactobacillus kunkeei]|uniref:heavy metal translocating P-type ATPase n=1 Tax=Apilactobacillus kunkeei TaxID=148814 RepID=UPI0006DA1E3B|nr:heavy metal translocating P-type ATPase [Apilactobacillus kunkeei]KPN82561.1 Copper transporting ATPase [Apilactobacillus kunkeei]MCK8619764.1 copper-translocating P-type ATPase [Apilactobacillus kunkeei]TPR53346.1 copper-translocating P-type ATPase [Apilactobacillus kunkeei]
MCGKKHDMNDEEKHNGEMACCKHHDHSNPDHKCDMHHDDMKMDGHSHSDHENMNCCSHGGEHDHSHGDHHCDMHHMDHDMGNMDHEHMHHDMSHMDHSHIGHDMSHMDHSHMGHDMGNMNMSGMGCGMDMGHGGMDHGGMGHMHMGNLKLKFWISLILTIPIIIMSPMMGMKMPFQVTFPGSDFVVLVLGTILFIYGGYPFFTSCISEMKSKKPGMMSLITMGISVAYVYSVYAVIANDILKVTPKVNDFFWELSTLIVIMLLGHWIEMNSVMNAGSALNKLAELLPDNAHLFESDGQTKDVSVHELSEGQTILIKSGEKVPADGTIIDGSTALNESLITGESRDVQKGVDDSVIGGSINGSGTIKVKITGTGESGYLSKVMNMVSEAQSSKSEAEDLANKVAGYLFYAALIVALIAFVTWSILDGVSYAIPITVSVLIIACPHALGLAIPLIISRMTSISATHGLLIRNKTALEGIKQIRYALMDKTGTLTQGDFKVNAYDSLDSNIDKKDVIKIAAAIEASSSHPLAQGIVQAFKDLNEAPLQAENVEEIAGSGIKGTVDGKEYQVVSSSYLDKNGIDYDQKTADKYLQQGNSLSYVVENGHVVGYIAEGDSIKPGAKDMIDFLNGQNIIPVMLTGDNQQAADKVASILGIKEVNAQLVPEDKQKLVTKYQEKGKVMFIGDGVNDAPSLTKADLGVAIGSGTDVAIESADVVLVNSDPADLINLVKLAKHARTKMIQNLWWGAGYNIIALPLAAGALSSIGIIIGPMLGAVIMSLSTVIVAINAMTLKIK